MIVAYRDEQTDEAPEGFAGALILVRLRPDEAERLIDISEDYIACLAEDARQSATVGDFIAAEQYAALLLSHVVLRRHGQGQA